MEAFLTQYWIFILFGAVALYLLTRGRRHLETVKSETKDAVIKALLKKTGIDKLETAEKVVEMAKIVKTVKSMNPKKLAGKAISVLAEEVAAIPDRDIPDLVDEEDDIDGLGAALNKAIKAEETREKWKRGGKKVVAIGAKILGSII